MRTRAILALLMLLVLISVLALGAQARVITDMAGREVTIPDKITKVYASDPYTTALLYSVAPDLSIGMQPGCLPLRDVDKHFIRKEMADLPLLATVSPAGEQTRVNIEAVLALKPQIALALGGKETIPMRSGDPRRAEQRFAKFNLPVVFIDIDRIEEYPAGIDFLGKLLGREKQARKLSAYARDAFAQVNKAIAKVPIDKRVRVYYAESVDGLATESDQSLHVDAIRMAGAFLVHRGEMKTHQGMEKMNMEQVLMYDPEVIISQEAEFTTNVYKDPRWANVKAVKNHRIYTVPRTPYSWIDRPPSVTRILGVQWVANRLYPNVYKVDMRKKIREFHRLFLGVEVTDADLNEWLK
jgi:iron complex transport system substrate-binding protein